MHRCFLIAIVAVFVSANFADAQQRRGRFFQKLKEDIFGSKQVEGQAEKSRTPTQSNSSNRQATANQQQSQSQYRPPNRRVPTMATNRRTPSDTTKREQGTASSVKYAPRSPYSYKAPQKTRAKPASSQQKGFGFLVDLDKDDQLVVSSVDRHGNAYSKGMRRGDELIEIGGIGASSVEEFEEISKIMNAGDQMEFKIKRSGREKEFEIMFGDVPNAEDLESTSSRSKSARYDFAPPTNTSRRSSSILNSSARGTNSSVSQKFSDQSNTSSVQRVQMLTQTIENQNRQIRMLQQQVQQLQRRGR